MAIYRFSFDDKYAGHTATVTDHNGNAVTGSPMTLDVHGDGALDLVTGAYRAQVSNAEDAFGDGYSAVDGVLSIEASFDASGSGIASTSIVSATIDWTGSHNIAGSYAVPFDNVREGSATFGANGHVNIAPGLYAVDIELDFTQPTTDTIGVNSSVFSSGGTFIRHNFAVEKVGTPGYIKLLSGVILVTAAGFNMTISGAAGTTDSLTLEYAYLSFAKLT